MTLWVGSVRPRRAQIRGVDHSGLRSEPYIVFLYNLSQQLRYAT